jgi:small subunit ribosomal protein S16
MFRMVVQDARRTPTSGKIVAQLGAYDPHAKSVSLDKDKAAFYLKNGAQPSDRAAKLLAGEGVKLPSWATAASSKAGKVRNPDKRRSTRPVEEQEAAVEAESANEAVEDAAAVEAADANDQDKPAEEPAAEAADGEPVAEAEAEAAPDKAENKASTEEAPQA